MSGVYEELPRTVVDGYIPYKVIANGYVVLNTDPNVSSNKIIDIRTSTKQIITATTGPYYQTVFMPVFAGHQIYFDAANFSWVNSCRFYYTIGEAKRLGLL